MRDETIIELYFARDEAAIWHTSEKYGAYCLKIAYNILLDVFDSEECVNDTWLRAWGAIPPTRPSILSSFLGRITRNLAIDRYNAKNAGKRGGRVAESLDELEECVGSPEVEDALSAEELGGMISRFLKGESQLARCIFVRRYFYQAEVAEIARKYGISVSNVKTTLHRTRKKLALYLKKEGVYI